IEFTVSFAQISISTFLAPPVPSFSLNLNWHCHCSNVTDQFHLDLNSIELNSLVL
ncbi:hypothetical protein AKO1_002243, partial [Acrasis kona]